MQEDDSVKMQELDDYNEALDKAHLDVMDVILSGEIFWLDGEAFSMDDFTCNFEIDSELFRSWLEDGCKKFKESTQEKLSAWCRELAIKYIEVIK